MYDVLTSAFALSVTKLYTYGTSHTAVSIILIAVREKMCVYVRIEISWNEERNDGQNNGTCNSYSAQWAGGTNSYQNESGGVWQICHSLKCCLLTNE
jgi:hypothetical protein